MKGKTAERVVTALTEKGYEAETFEYDGVTGVRVSKSSGALPVWASERLCREGFVRDRSEKPGYVDYVPRTIVTDGGKRGLGDLQRRCPEDGGVLEPDRNYCAWECQSPACDHWEPVELDDSEDDHEIVTDGGEETTRHAGHEIPATSSGPWTCLRCGAQGDLLDLQGEGCEVPEEDAETCHYCGEEFDTTQASDAAASLVDRPVCGDCVDRVMFGGEELEPLPRFQEASR